MSPRFTAIRHAAIGGLLVGCLLASPAWGSIASGPLPFESYEAPQDMPAFDQAGAAFKRGEPEKALTLFEDAVRQRPELPPAPFLLAKLFLANNQPELARPLLERAAAHAANEPDVHLVLGQMALGEGRLSDAQLQFERAASLVTTRTWNESRKAKCHQLSHRGLAAIAELRGDWANARRHLAALLEIDPRAAADRQRLGRAHFFLKDFQAAAKEIQHASVDDPLLETASVVLARLYAQLGDAAKAEASFQQALVEHPQDYRGHLAYAAWLLERERAADAERAAAAALKLSPASRDVRYLNGTVARYLRQDVRAEEQFAELHAEYPANLEIANQLALCLAEQEDAGKRDRGLQLAISNVRQQPDSRELHATLGWCYFRCGKLDEAAQSLHHAISGGQGPAAAGYYLACVMDKLDQKDQIEPLLQAASKARAPFRYRLEVNEWLASLAPAGE